MKNKVKLFGKEYDRNNLPSIIESECGCKYKNNCKNCRTGISFIAEHICDEHKIVIDIDKEKYKKNKQLKENITHLIYKDYPIWKQLNITRLTNGYKEVDVQKMDKFIKEKIKTYNNIEQLINNCTTIKELVDIEI